MIAAVLGVLALAGLILFALFLAAIAVLFPH